MYVDGVCMYKGPRGNDEKIVVRGILLHLSVDDKM